MVQPMRAARLELVEISGALETVSTVFESSMTAKAGRRPARNGLLAANPR